MLGQFHYLFSQELAKGRGLLPNPGSPQHAAQHLQEQQQEHVEPRQVQPAQAQQDKVQPCSEAPAAAVQEASCRTPLSQLRAERLQVQVEDSSPSNNLVRRLATNINTDSPALTSTLAEYSYSNVAPRSTASFRSRASTPSDLSMEGSGTPLASPGCSWASPPAASRASLQRGSSSGQSPAASHGRAAGLQASSTPQCPSQLQLQMQVFGLGGSSLHSACSAHSPLTSPSCQHSAVQEPAGLQPVPSLLFSGFGGSERSQDSASGGILLANPSLQQRWVPLSNDSSSNGTINSQDHFSSCSDSGSDCEDMHHSTSAIQPNDDSEADPPCQDAANRCSTPARGITTEVRLVRPWWTMPLLFSKNVLATLIGG